MTRLAGKVALVTGAASGLGRASALRLANEGVVVACLDLTADAAGVVVEEIERSGGRAWVSARTSPLVETWTPLSNAP